MGGAATPRAVATALAVAVAATACGSAIPRPTAPARPAASLPLATSVTTGQVTWAVVPMGAATGPNLFWQLFTQAAGSSRWSLATPSDVATNGALALAAGPGRSLVAGIHPSLLLGFSPVTSTSDGGRTWHAGAPDPGLASVPDALAAAPRPAASHSAAPRPAASHSAAPGGGQLIALDRDGRAELSGARAGAAGWTTLTSARALAATQAARACGLSALTAAAFSPAGDPVLAGACRHPGTAGIFADQGGRWRAIGPLLPAALRGQQVLVLRLVRTAGRLTALLQAGSARTASLLAAWRDGTRWRLSAPLSLPRQAALSSSFGSAGSAAVELGRRRAEYLSGPGASWQPLPALPAGRSVTLALPASGTVAALAADGSTLTAWRLGPGARPAPGDARWVQTQVTHVPIQYGSSS